jgi:hypothetical protein
MTPEQVKDEYRKRINLLKNMYKDDGYSFHMHGRFNHCSYNFEREFKYGGGSIGYVTIQWTPCCVQSHEENTKGYKIACGVVDYVRTLFPYAKINHFTPFFVDMRVIHDPDEESLTAPVSS